jgi:hypothetical protein
MAQFFGFYRAQEQLEYWRAKLKAALDTKDAERIVQCKRYVRQCETVVAALKQADAPLPSNLAADAQGFFSHKPESVKSAGR